MEQRWRKRMRSDESLKKDVNRSLMALDRCQSASRESELAVCKTLAFGFGTCARFFCRLRFFARCQSDRRTGLQCD